VSGFVSTTVITMLHCVLFPALSLEVQTTSVEPSWKVLPGGGMQATGRWPSQASLATGSG
jgi:hypothetical protein